METESKIYSSVVLGDYIYYTKQFEKSYKYNKKAKEMTPVEDIEQGPGMEALAALDYYPDLKGKIAKITKDNKNLSGAYLEEDRIFIEFFSPKGKTYLYEYVPKKNKLKKIATFKDSIDKIIIK